MIQWEPPYKGVDKNTNFPLLVHGAVVVGAHVEVICVDAEGNLVSLLIENVNVDYRFDPKVRNFVSIDDPSTEG